MALTISNVTTANSTTSGATLDLTGVSAAIGDWLVLAVAADNFGAAGISSTSSTITDAAGNTWTQRSSTNNTPAAAAQDGTTLTIWTCAVTATLSSATITVNFSPNTTAKAALLKKVVPGTGEAVRFISVGVGFTGTTTPFSSGNVSVDVGYTIFGYTSLENNSVLFTPDSDTTNGTWSTQQTAAANTGVAGTSQAITGQHKTVTASGNQSYDTAFGSNKDSALNYIILSAKVATSLAATEAADTASFTADLIDGATLSATEAADTASFSASILVSAVLAATEAADTADFTVTETIHATLAATEAADTAAFTASLSVEAGLAATEAPDTAAFTVSVRNAAVLAASERPDRAQFLIGIAWPSARLPLPTLAGYDLKPNATVMRSAVEIGTARVYRRTRQPMVDVAVAWHLDGWQQMLLDGFYRSVALEGGQWFVVTLGFPSGMAAVSARFKDKLAMRALGGQRWHATATLELLGRPVISDADLTALLGDEGEEPAWPTALLPKPLQDSWELQPKPVVARSEDLPGLPRQRQRSRNAPTEVDARWELSAVQAEIFDGFFRWRGRDGARWFSFPLYQGIGTIQTEVRFLGEADWAPRAGGRWAVTAPIEIRERTILNATDYAELVDEDPLALLGAIGELNDLVETGFAEVS